jgi:transcriptional regulator with XRE-family HTH domain
MFDTMQIAKRIKKARIDKNMTQLQLADAMGVSYQAVSNWERGNSMPDISKLTDLCSTLGLTVNELLGLEEKTTAAVTKAIEKGELAVEELEEVAPMLPPEQVVDFVKKAKKKMDLSAIMNLAPFLDEEYLSNLVDEAGLEDLSQVVCLAPFLSGSCLRKLVSRCEDTNDFATIMSLAQFLDRETLDNLVDGLVMEDLWQAISLAPFLSNTALDKLVMRCEADADMDALSSLAPFLSKETLRNLADKMLEDENGMI